MSISREKYFPVNIGTDLVRNNMFEVVLNSFIDTNSELRFMCETFSYQLPNTSPVNVKWMGGETSLAGNISGHPQFTLTFYVAGQIGQQDTFIETGIVNQDALHLLYEWRKKVFNFKNGTIHSASNYKATANLHVYDVTGDIEKFHFKCEGMWPSAIQQISLDVANADAMKITATFECDKTYMVNSISGDEGTSSIQSQSAVSTVDRTTDTIK